MTIQFVTTYEELMEGDPEYSSLPDRFIKHGSLRDLLFGVKKKPYKPVSCLFHQELVCC
jgi:hypothetical protein